jgi:hypothetical protein
MSWLRPVFLKFSAIVDTSHAVGAHEDHSLEIPHMKVKRKNFIPVVEVTITTFLYTKLKSSSSSNIQGVRPFIDPFRPRRPRVSSVVVLCFFFPAFCNF